MGVWKSRHGDSWRRHPIRESLLLAYRIENISGDCEDIHVVKV